MSYGKKTGPEPTLCPPLDFDAPSNGEFHPLPPTVAASRRLRRWREIVEAQHRRLGLTRRQFAESACGTAAWLLVINQIACDDGGASTAAVPPGADAGPDAAGLPGDASGYDVTPDMT